MIKLIYLLLFAISVLSTSVSANDSFMLNSIEEAKNLASITNKPLLIIFGSDYCKFCQELKKDILSKKLSPDIDKYIICYIDLETDEHIKKKYNVSMIPDSRILIKDKEIKKIKGYSKNNYLKWLIKK